MRHPVQLGMAGEAFFQRESSEDAEGDDGNGSDGSSDSSTDIAARGDLHDAASAEGSVQPISVPKAVASAEEYSLRSETDIDTDPGTGIASPGRWAAQSAPCAAPPRRPVPPARPRAAPEAFPVERGRREGESEESW